MRHRADTNQQEIVDALRKIGVSVLVLSQVGSACPDLMIGWRGKNYLLEIKTENGKLSKVQEEFFDTWRGRCFIVRSVEEALELLECL
jgi:Holliday junction resolvase